MDNGIPTSPNEDFSRIFNKICLKIGLVSKESTYTSLTKKSIEIEIKYYMLHICDGIVNVRSQLDHKSQSILHELSLTIGIPVRIPHFRKRVMQNVCLLNLSSILPQIVSDGEFSKNGTTFDRPNIWSQSSGQGIDIGSF